LQLRLSAGDIERLIAGYQGGATVYRLAQKLGVHRRSLSHPLRAGGVDLRADRINAVEDKEAIRLYTTGMSLKALSQQLGYSADTISGALARAGIGRRSCSASRSTPRQACTI
jgi:lambda repressor-like predicted transcriptional regulator